MQSELHVEDAIATSVAPLSVARDDIEVRIAEIEAQMRARARRTRYVLVLSGVPIAIGTLVAIFSKSFDNPADATLIGWTVAGYAFFGGAVALFLGQRRMSALEQEQAVLAAKKRILAPARAGAGESTMPPGSYFDRLVDINLTNLGAYYGLVKVHANNGFLIATVAGAIGFALVILGLVLGLVGDPAKTKDVSQVAAAAGVITEFIAGVFFYLYNKTVRQLKDYHDSLLAVQNVLLSFKLVGDTQDSAEKARMIGQLLLYLVGKRTPDEIPKGRPAEKTEAAEAEPRAAPGAPHPARAEIGR